MTDSKAETLEHIRKVQDYIGQVKTVLSLRGRLHDATKLQEPEKSLFDKYTPKLKDAEYGSKEYKARLEGLKPALDHHYATYRHHPEHFEFGVREMNLIDMIEMLADWKAATERMADGDLDRSITINKKRFLLGDDLERLLRNTAKDLGWI